MSDGFKLSHCVRLPPSLWRRTAQYAWVIGRETRETGPLEDSWLLRERRGGVVGASGDAAVESAVGKPSRL